MHILLWSITKHGPPHAILVSDWPILKNLFLWNCLAKLSETWQESSMECPLWRLLISSRSVNKHGHHRQFLFLIGRYLRKSSLKLPSQINLVGSIYMYGRLCIKFPQSRMKVEWHRLITEPLVSQKYFIWSHKTCSCSSSGFEEELLLVTVIWNPRWSLASDWLKHFKLLSQKNYTKSLDFPELFL